MIEAYDIPITRRDLQTLEKLNWLNDSIINFYLQMIAQRSMSCVGYPKVYSFNTFFYPKVAQFGRYLFHFVIISCYLLQ
ncbi:MAG: hypothetical protein FJX80_15865, partial [Bacteroidetes bacterium]|nr:hypothetical protein [Bacteroidota bacterium]